MLEMAIYQQTGFAHLTDLPCIRLQAGTASAVVSLYGAQVLSYQPKSGHDVLWLSPLATWHNNTAIRGGVPICWPWFGPADIRLNPAQQALPNHGLVRTRLWQLTQQHITPCEAGITLQITVDDLPCCTSSVTLQLQLTLTADSLSIKLRCDSTILQQGALHSYFRVVPLPQTRVQPLPLQYIDKVAGSTVIAESDQADFTAEVDRVYSSPAALLQIHSDYSQINITQAGQDATVVWNPWQERSMQIADLADHSYLEFICVETARLQLDNALPLDLTQQIEAVN